ncbi:MAG: hypothetical protein R6U67_06490 [Sodalinema sp.]
MHLSPIHLYSAPQQAQLCRLQTSHHSPVIQGLRTIDNRPRSVPKLEANGNRERQEGCILRGGCSPTATISKLNLRGGCGQKTPP